ncbi:MAG: tetratricopeptide repeat protein [Actinomycetia bacterium]|nr:tetratricopeptide repeat protein [Actinomycetes bacterium]
MSSVVASKMYDSGSYGLAQGAWNVSLIAPFGNDFAVHYNIGNAEYQKGNWDEAIERYSKAINSDDLNIVCPALYNWAQALVKLADGNLANNEFENAIGRYSKALSLVSRQSCVNTEEYQQQFEDLGEEIEEKIDEAEQAAGEDEGDDEEGSQQERETDAEVEQEIDNIEEEVDQLRRSDNTNRSDETRGRDEYNVIW